MKLAVGKVLLVNGPVSVIAKSEGVSVLGASLKPDKAVIVKRNKVLPFEVTQGEASLLLTVGEGGNYFESSSKVGTSFWHNLLDEVLNIPARGKILVMGETDAGKSTLTAFLVNSLLSSHKAVGVVDGDVGQGDLAPPGCVGVKAFEKQVYDLRDEEAQVFRFLGITSPLGFESVVIDELVMASARLEGKCEMLVVNTDGYVRNGGVEYKTEMVKRLQPEMIICLSDSDGCGVFYHSMKDRCEDFRIVLVDRAEGIVKSQVQREERRLSQYRCFLSGGKRVSRRLDELNIAFLGSLYTSSSGFPPHMKSDERGNTISITRSLDDYIAVNLTERTETFFSRNILQNMFVGLGFDGEVTGVARIVGVEQDLLMKLDSPVKDFNTIHLSTIRLSDDGMRESVMPVFKRRFIP